MKANVKRTAVESINYIISRTGHYLTYNSQGYEDTYTGKQYATLDEAIEHLDSLPEIQEHYRKLHEPR